VCDKSLTPAPLPDCQEKTLGTDRKHLSAILLILLLAVLSACHLPTVAQSTPTHRIGVRVVNGVGEFYDRITGSKFVPRGSNYVHVGPQAVPGGGQIVYHTVFDPGKYDASRVETALQRMHGDGYNVVRIWLSFNTLGDPSGGLSTAYLKNVVDFLNRAKANQIYVLVTQDWLPAGKYSQILNQACCNLFAAGNLNYLSSPGLTANQVYFRDLIRELIALSAPLDSVFAFELRNELYFESDLPPLSLSSGQIRTANGQAYDMANPRDKERMMEENLPYWIDQLRAAIRDVDPTALVTVGFFAPQKPNKTRVGDSRLISTYPAIWQSHADFIDLHPYPGFDLNLKQYVENFQINGMQEKPIIMGEFGANANVYPSIEKAARALMAWQADSCQYGFDGWILWTWDDDEEPDFYNALSGDDLIEKVLAPANRPDPCVAQAPGLLENNVAAGKSVMASRSVAGSQPSNAADGDPSTWWVSGAFPPQWVEIDLGQPYDIQTIRLQLAQDPAGNTVQQIWVRGPSDALRLVHEFSGHTRDNQILEFKPAMPLSGVQHVKVVTAQGVSWPAWKEIEVITIPGE
jgi:Cellulase (glycosyl hydrolase family 5)/F5/8 type C domain